jgi:surface polysaccharide O-acyltransferase-like enzyme
MANLFVAITYGMVGWYLADCQVRRHVAEKAWSLSGVSLSVVFFTCALMHLIYATTERHSATLLFDLFGVPASIYFLWIVKRVHSDSVVDWNRRPLVGAASRPARSSPWSGSDLTGNTRKR